MGQGSNFNLTKGKRFPFSQQASFCGREEEELEHILIHCLAI